MGSITRRAFTRFAAAAVAVPAMRPARAQAAARVVIVGGGAGGASLAYVLKAEAAQLDVTLIEANPIYSSCFFSNLYLAGLRSLESLSHSYVGLARLGVKVVHDVATDVDAGRRSVRTKGGRTYGYDKLVLSPGIDIDYESVPGHSRDASRNFPHAYTTATIGKRLLRRQLQGMREGGLVVMALPANPYRCPPGPYERACMIAHFLKARKPRAKLVLIDPKRSFSKQDVFMEAFERHYKGIVEVRLTTDIDDFAIARLDARERAIRTRAGLLLKPDVGNVIPQQKAGEIARRAGCTEGAWCPVDPATFASERVPHVFVIGDAAIAGDMPKSAYAANSQAKLVAAELLAELAGAARYPARARNTCWSMLAPEDCVKIGAGYEVRGGRLEAVAPFMSSPGEPGEVRRANVAEANGWYDALSAEMFGLLRANAAAGGGRG
ncbi:MAG: NAD(P)/FAD-dependent oxidoreductase [Hyphomicrobiaceae bacterium]|nr:NAD(P)/FAD-dependent oxidoreductase [Hyphomicrobiaceae bacterium]